MPDNALLAGECPVPHGHRAPQPIQGGGNRAWWPERLNVKILANDPIAGNPLGEGFNYAEAFALLDFAAVKVDIATMLTTSQDWWPANTNLDKARRLLWPIKKKCGQNLSWADLIILTGNVALETMGLPTFGFAGGRVDTWESDDDVYWGPETTWLGNDRYTGDRELEKPLAAVQMGLIYVNPEGPDGVPDPLGSARDIRETFKRMAMNDEETVALIAGGHTFGKTHGAAPDSNLGLDPEAAPLEEMGLGWKNEFGTGKGDDTITSGLEVTWTYHPTRWDNEYFHILFAYEWELMESPAGAKQWRPVNGGGSDMVPLAHDASTHREPRMLTSDIALRADPDYEAISRRFAEDQDAFADAFARAWFKLTHRDMGPKARYLGPEVPAEELSWQDPLPEAVGEAIGDAEIATLKASLLASGLTVSQLVSTAWASASTFRGSDKRGGANGARIRLEPQRSWVVNNPARLATVLTTLESIQMEFNATSARQVSLADLIVLAGGVGVEQSAKDAGFPVTVPFAAGRVDALEEQTDVESFAYLEPIADGFRNYSGPLATLPAEHHLVDKANLLILSAPEMTVLVGGLRVLGTNYDDSSHGVLTETPGVLTNDFFGNLLEMGTTWTALDKGAHAYSGSDYGSDAPKWVGTRADLVFGSSSELRALAEVYASDDAKEKFVSDFVAAWTKVMNLDRFDLR